MNQIGQRLLSLTTYCIIEVLFPLEEGPSLYNPIETCSDASPKAFSVGVE
jgi:hypothetical protein